jgi:uncharacterized protein DUF1707
MGDLQPRMRAGDKDRQRVVEQLGKHFAEGRLTVAEFDERVVRAHGSVYLDELPGLTIDLPSEATPRRSAPRRSAAAPSVFVVLLAMLLGWSLLVAVVEGFPVILVVLLLVLFHRHRRWSRRW